MKLIFKKERSITPGPKGLEMKEIPIPEPTIIRATKILLKSLKIGLISLRSSQIPTKRAIKLAIRIPIKCLSKGRNKRQDLKMF